MNSSTIEWVGYIQDQISSNYYQQAFYAAICSALVGLTGLVPIFFLPVNFHSNSEDFRFLLSFAVGGLLGDVFLHLLPEALASAQDHSDFSIIGCVTLFGLLVFTITEKLLQSQYSTGYLNLIANCIDNFNHGLAVGGAFLISTKVGFVTTGCILIHEIPHEVGDFAILIKSGFNREEAAKAQFTTAFVGIFGALFALALDFGILSFFIVPFTCGGFLHISLVSVMPELLESQDITDFIKVLSGISLGTLTMMLVSSL